MAGLTCALELERRGVDYRLLEAAESVGGRVATDNVQGFLLDRGFQVFLTGYPELRRLLNYQHLKLRPLRSGAVIRSGGGWVTLPDPLKNPAEIWQTLRSPVGNLADKIRMGWLALRSLAWNEQRSFRGHPETTKEFLCRWGFSSAIVEQFWRPFFGGIFLEDELTTGSDLFRFLFPLFAWSQVALPAAGMQQIPFQLERRLTPGRLLLQRRVVRREGSTCWDDAGEHWEGEHLVLACDEAGAARLLNQASVAQRGTHCTYFAAPASIGGQGRIHLNPQAGCIHHLVVLSDSVPEYAPAGQSLVSVSSQGPQCPTEGELRALLGEWFGQAVVESWKCLRQYSLPRALPVFAAGQGPADLKLGEGLWRCGDYVGYPSLNAAVASGRRVAESLGYGAAK
jgi:phytoene dehydrogenase-like protein